MISPSHFTTTTQKVCEAAPATHRAVTLDGVIASRFACPHTCIICITVDNAYKNSEMEKEKEKEGGGE